MGGGIYVPLEGNASVHQYACTNIFFVYLFYVPNVFLGHIKEKSTSINALFWLLRGQTARIDFWGAYMPPHMLNRVNLALTKFSLGRKSLGYSFE